MNSIHSGEKGSPVAGSNEEAQRRADRIRLFSNELAALEKYKGTTILQVAHRNGGTTW